MERLLKDAEKLTGVKYDINNLSDVYSAIHAIQGQLGLTGSAANEAAETFSGSMNSMKAAATNLMGNLAIGADITPSLNQLIDTVFVFVQNNLLPMVGNILKGVPDIVSSVLSGLIGALNVASNSEGMVQAGLDIVKGLVAAIVEAAPYIAEAAIRLVVNLGKELLNTDWIGTANELISSLKDSLTLASGEILGSDDPLIPSVMKAISEKLPELLNKGVEMVTNIANGIWSSYPKMLESAGTILNNFLAYWMQNMPTILQVGVKLLLNLAQGIANSLPTIISTAGTVIANLLATFAKHLPQLLQQGITMLGQLAAGLIQAIPTLVGKIPTIISSIKDAFGKFDWKSIGSDIISGVSKGISSAVGMIVDAAKDAASRAFEAAKDFLGIASPSKLFRYEIGARVSEGFALGITDNTSMVSSAMDELTKEATGTVNASVAMGIGQSRYGQLAMAGSGATGGFQQNVNIYSPRELSPSEVARQTRNATRNMVLSLQGA